LVWYLPTRQSLLTHRLSERAFDKYVQDK